MIDLLTVDQAEDAAASAMASLLWMALQARGWIDPESPGTDIHLHRDLVEACRTLLRGPVAEACGIDQPHLGGYCMKAPTDPTLRALGRLGAQIVELSYTVGDPVRAMADVAALFEEVQRVARS